MLGEDFSEKPKLKEEMPGCDVSYTKISCGRRSIHNNRRRRS